MHTKLSSIFMRTFVFHLFFDVFALDLLVSYAELQNHFCQLGNYPLFLKQLGNFDLNRVIKKNHPLQ